MPDEYPPDWLIAIGIILAIVALIQWYLENRRARPR